MSKPVPLISSLNDTNVFCQNINISCPYFYLLHVKEYCRSLLPLKLIKLV